ncbi:hypothetical protein [Lysobacter niastensis]|uniref:Uncharacterized protein n=1 Tax=Lysobacter niastensis TaxID=380629 RepID=A0ABS0BA10_9GAMM|nr:hypothetical protein [Lysobacter niastensis]MBF6023970.1 hypothetical protein [Lysobacter niastensis]
MDNPPLAVALDLLTLATIALIAWHLGQVRWFFRIPLSTLIGWPIFAGAVALHWSILAASAQTPQEAEWVAAHDTGPLAVSVVLGWAYALVVVLVTETVRGVVLVVRRVAVSRQSV